MNTLDWKEKLKLIGDLYEIVRKSEKAGRLTSQQKRRSTVILRKLKFARTGEIPPLNRR